MREIAPPLTTLARLTVIFHKHPEIAVSNLPCTPKHNLQGQALALAIASAIVPVGASAADVYWNAITGNWADPNNWYAGVLPTAADNVFINSVPIFDPDAIPATILTIDDASSAANPALAGNLYIDNFDPIQSLTLNQTGGVLSVNGAEYVGSAGVGSIQQSGGTNSTTRLEMGSQNGGLGSYTLSGGNLTVSDTVSIGGFGQGSFNQSGGVHTADTLIVGDYILGYIGHFSGAYTLSAGILNAQTEIIGLNSNSDFFQNGGDNNVGNKLWIGWGGAGNYTLSSGNLTTAHEVIGLAGGNGLFTQNSGTHTVGDGGLTLGLDPGSRGRYLLSGGTLTASKESIGEIGIGVFTQSGGAHEVTNLITIGENGTYNLQDGTLTTQGLRAQASTATFLWTGGALRYTKNLNISADRRANNESIFRSAFTVGTGQNFIAPSINVFSDGVVNQSGGSIEAQNQVNLAGTYNFSGGTLTTAALTKNGDSANFNWTGGELHYTTDFNVTAGASYFGDHFSIGTGRGFQAPNLTVATDGVVSQDGGNVQVESTLNLNGRYALGGGTLTVGGASVANSAPSQLTLAGGVLNNNGELALAGGALQANRVNNYALVNGYGSISADNFTNYGLFTQGAGNLSLNGYQSYGTFENAGNMLLAGGRQLQLSNNIGFYNYGSLDLNNAIVTGTGALENNSGGVISGRGAIASSFSNNGGMLVVENGTTRVNDGFFNTGVVQLNSASANLTGGLISNGLLGWDWDEASQMSVQTWTGGTIQGYGQIASAIDNNPNSIIEARGGALTLTGAVSNTGTLAAGAGAKLMISQGLANNDGDINLEGGSFDNNNHTLINNGQINGHGSLRSGGLTNLGQMTLANGNTTINGAVTNGDINDTSAVLEVSHSQALFTDAVVNYGTFKNTSSSITFAAEYIENGLYYSDPAVNIFNSTVTVGENGYLLGGTGDEFHYKRDLIVHSLRDTDWNTDQAALFFDGSIEQSFYLAGADAGTAGSGFTDNFSWGSLNISAGTTLNLLDGNATSGAALYVHDINVKGLDVSTLFINSIIGGYNIYYDKDSIANAYLGGATFSFAGGGQLIGVDLASVPLPNAFWLFGTALIGLGRLGKCARPRPDTEWVSR